MKKILNWAIALLPLVCLFGLVLFHRSAMQNYFLCKGVGCESIPLGAEKIFNTPDDLKNCNPPWPDTKEIKAKDVGNPEADALRYSGRLTSLFLGMLYLIVCGIAVLVGVGVFYCSVRGRWWGRIFWLAVAIGAAILVGTWLYCHPDEYIPVLHSIAGCTINLDVHGIFKIVNRWSSVGFAVGFFMWLATCAVLIPTSASSNLNENLKKLSTRMKYLNIMLSVEMVILVVGVLLERSIFQWTLAFISGNEHAVKAADSFITSLVAFDGGFYTLLLAALYLPAAFIIRSRAEQQEGWAEHTSKKEKLEEFGLNFSIAKSIPRIVTILAPLLAGPIGELFSHLAK